MIERDPIFIELAALIASPWASIPRVNIPLNWRDIEPAAYNLAELRAEQAGEPIAQRSVAPDGLAGSAMANERARRGRKYGSKSMPREFRVEIQCQQMRRRMALKRRAA